MRAVDGQVVGFQPTPNYDAFIWQNPDSVTGDEPARDVANKALKLFDEEKYHDIDVETGSMILSDNPLLAHPFRNSQVIPLLFPLSAYLTGSGDPLTPFLACVPRDKRCVTSLSYATMALTLFVFSHELTHIRDGHRAQGNVQPLSNEIRADANAFAIGKKVCDKLPNDAKLTAIPANLLNEGLAATDGKQYSFFVRN
jgi:hypothetical protein